MEVTYDAEVDILSITLTVKAAKESKEILPGVVADLDADGRMIALEIFDAKELTDLTHLKVEVAAGDERTISVTS